MRRTILLLCLLFAFQPAARAQAMANANPRCEATKAPEPIALIGRQLRETPDLAPELQRLNQMSNVNGCIEYAYGKVAQYQQLHPEDVGVQFLVARYLWRYGNIEGGIELLERVVREHPDFASGLVLLGAMHRERSSLTPARDYLARALKVSPDDLWGNINQLLLQAQLDTNDAARAQLLEIALTKQAPPFARSSATDFLLRSMDPLAKGAEYESLLRTKLEYDEGHYREETLFNLARFYVYSERHTEARPILQQLLQSPNLDRDQVASELAESYLREAANIARNTIAANQALVEQARKVVNNDFSALQARLARNPELNQKLAPFMQGGQVDTDARDGWGHTRLCNAAQMGDLLALQDEIRAGADVNTMCAEMTALAIAGGSGNVDVETRKTMFAYLLEHGADPDHSYRQAGEAATFEYQCKDRPECRDNLLPILRAHQAKQAAAR